MTFSDKVHSLFTYLFHRKQSTQPVVPSNQDQKNGERAESSNNEPYSQRKSETYNNDQFGALSEVAASEPVEQPPDEQRARIPSLEQRLSKSTHQNGKNEDSGSLSEVATPQPIRKRSDGEEERLCSA